MKKIIISFFTIFILFLFQTCVFRHLSFNGIVPNLIFMIVCIYGVIRGELDGIFAGFFCGIVLDLLYSDVIGYYALCYMYAGYLNGLLNKYYFEFEHKLPVFCVALSNIAMNIVNYCILFLLKGRFNFKYYMNNIIVPELVYTIVLFFAVYPIVIFLEHRFIENDVLKEEEDVI